MGAVSLGKRLQIVVTRFCELLRAEPGSCGSAGLGPVQGKHFSGGLPSQQHMHADHELEVATMCSSGLEDAVREAGGAILGEKTDFGGHECPFQLLVTMIL